MQLGLDACFDLIPGTSSVRGLFIFGKGGIEGLLISIRELAIILPGVAGHIPGRPLLPGVLMIEAGAQLASFYTRTYVGWKGFIGFGGVDEVKFRMQVPPGVRMYILGKKLWERHHRIYCNVQGWVDGNLAFEAGITGTEF